MDVFLIGIIILLILLALARGAVSFAPWVPVPIRDLKRINKLADLREEQVFFDLGSGDGRVVFYIAKKNRKVRCVGVELAWPLWLFSELRKFFLARRNANFQLKNFYKVNLSEADLIYFFGTPSGINQKLKDKLKSDLKPGAKVISYVFSIKGWEPKIIDKPNEKEAAIYVYEVIGN